MTNILKLARPNILSLKPYSSARDEFSGAASVFLDANENPFPSLYNRYPDPHQTGLKKIIAGMKGMNIDQVFLGNGSDEAIDLMIRAFCEPGTDNMVIPEPTYGMYAVSANVNNIRIKNAMLTPDFDIDVKAIEQATDQNTKLLFLCSPNNPTGNLLNFEKIQQLLSTFPGLVIVDEAYIDFAGYPGFLPLLKDYPNLVVLQTLSKAWGLAGIRLGTCFANPAIIELLNRIKPPYNISVTAQTIAAEQLLKNRGKKEQWVNEIILQRGILGESLKKIKTVKKIYPSSANFLLVKMERAKEVYAKLVMKGIIVRDRSNVILCDDCLRITVGTADENKLLINELTAL